MIGYLTGSIIHKDSSFVILETGGVGYKVYTIGNTIETLADKVSFWIHTAIRENSHDLYGFLSREELSVFELLITVSGIGPKTALGVLNVAPIETLRHAVASENIAHLVKISGIGKRIAEKIVLELRGKLGAAQDATEEDLRDEGDVIEALGALGFSQKQARDALKDMPKEITGTSEKVKHALKLLSKNS
jgi:Holliday junction DNA helicase RuvA